MGFWAHLYFSRTSTLAKQPDNPTAVFSRRLLELNKNTVLTTRDHNIPQLKSRFFPRASDKDIEILFSDRLLLSEELETGKKAIHERGRGIHRSLSLSYSADKYADYYQVEAKKYMIQFLQA